MMRLVKKKVTGTSLNIFSYFFSIHIQTVACVIVRHRRRMDGRLTSNQFKYDVAELANSMISIA